MVHVHHGIVLEVPDDSRDLFDRIVVLEIPNINGAEAKQETLGTFLGRSKINGGCSLKSARYGVPPIEVWVKRRGTCYVEHSSPVNEVLARAYSLLQKTEQNPCPAVRRATSEDLAFWCKTGKSRSAVPNNIGGTNYGQAYPQPTSSLEATRATEVTAPQATSSNPEAKIATPASAKAEEVDKRDRILSDPDAFRLLEEGDEPRPSTPRCTEILANDADLESYEVVDIQPWSHAEHHPAVVKAQA